MVLILVFTLAFVFRASLMTIGDASGPPGAFIYQQGRLVKQMDLNQDQQINLLEGKMAIRVEGEKISVSQSECPRKVCVNTGWIRHPGESIVCVPYKVLIEVKSGQGSGVDAVVY